MPETMARVEAILEWLKDRGVPPVTLLVVPGKRWTEEQTGRLRELAESGHTLAAHGWHHRTRPRKLYHRLHAALISRDVAEHLDLNSREILDLLNRSKNWFQENSLPCPNYYVPPAWALGFISKEDLRHAPYDLIETTRGLIQPSNLGFHKLPLTGYEADTPLREAFLRRWNKHQERSATSTDKALRISIHPNDLQLRVADQLEEQIRAPQAFINPADLTAKLSN